ncbi:MAG TPA: FAD-dependent oxidoreductase [Candidatus Limnocylindrales bacterium]|nr:FAD-dependent oxidoreductase [Candidatus Limnocylindrales bacterium]
MAKPDLLIVGGGIIGCSAAAFAAEQGASVLLVEGSQLAAGASGRNSGVVQHPFDTVLAPLHQATLEVYRELSDGSSDFEFPADPSGLLLLTDDAAAAHARVAELLDQEPALAAEFLDSEALAALEPMLAHGLSAIRLATGYPIPPEAATRAMAARAMRAGAELRIAQPVSAVHEEPAVSLADGNRLEAGAVLVAAGPWSAPLLDPSGAWQPIRPTHGVTVQVSLPTTPSSVLEEGAVHTVNRPVAGGDAAAGLVTFSMVSAAGISTVGSTFLSAAPDPEQMAPVLLAHGSRFVPALRDAAILRSRVCARPQSIDGHPFIGPLPGRARVFMAAGHGPWGISTGPASAAIVVDAILRGTPVPAGVEAARPL